MKKLNVLIAACTLIAVVLFSSNTVKAEIAVSKTVNMADTAKVNAALVQEYTKYFKQGASRGTLNKAMTADIDTSYDEVIVVQLNGTHSISPSVKGPETQYVARVKFKDGTIGWVLAVNSDQLLGTLNAAYYPNPNTNACTGCSKIAWKQGDADDEVEIPASAIE